MDQVEIDIEQVRLGFGTLHLALAHNVCVPDLLCERVAHDRFPFGALLLTSRTDASQKSYIPDSCPDSCISNAETAISSYGQY